MDNVTIYKPNKRHEIGFFRTWVIMAKNIIGARELIWQLYKRDLLAVYKKSFIGWVWLLISPLVSVLTWVFLHSTGLFNPGELDIPYPAYALISTTMWNLFMMFYQAAAQTLSAGSNLVMHVKYPHEIFLFVKTVVALTNFIIVFIITLLFLALFNVIPGTAALYFPLVILPLFFLGASIGLMVSIVSVVAFDIDNVIQILMGFWLVITPVIYSPKINNELIQSIIRWNPLTYLVGSARDIIVYGRLYEPDGFFICSAISFVFFLISIRLFYVSEKRIIERMI